jgi:hypothetical protein
LMFGGGNGCGVWDGGGGGVGLMSCQSAGIPIDDETSRPFGSLPASTATATATAIIETLASPFAAGTCARGV